MNPIFPAYHAKNHQSYPAPFYSFEISVDMLDYMDEILNFEETGESFLRLNILVDFFQLILVFAQRFDAYRICVSTPCQSVSLDQSLPGSWRKPEQKISPIIKHFLLKPEGNYVILYLRVAFFSLATFQSVIFGYRARVEL